MLRFLGTVLIISAYFVSRSFAGGYPDGKIYGVNLGSWLVLEPWMLPNEWKRMGGQNCNGCSGCIGSEFDLVKANPQTADQVFLKHWQASILPIYTWFAQSDVDKLASLGINTVRIPLGYWIIEPLVDRSTEFYPRGGLAQLKRGLKQLKTANIAVLLDHHALPGVQTPNQAFAGHCTSDVQFYTDANYNRALQWTAIMAAISHLDPDFGSVFAIEAVNEPIADASNTPGYGDFQKNFVQVVRAVEQTLGIGNQSGANNFTVALSSAAQNSAYNSAVRSALSAAAPMLSQVAQSLGEPTVFSGAAVSNRSPLATTFMDYSWQRNNQPNPADAAKGPQLYDHHLYFSYGVASSKSIDGYLQTICKSNTQQTNAAKGNSPMFCGEFALSTDFTATDDDLKRWADAQKFIHSKAGGWMFWGFKTESSDLGRQWSYVEGVERGYFTTDPSAYNDEHVCDAYGGSGGGGNGGTPASDSSSSKTTKRPMTTAS
ncbi:glycoside hydrolase family 5 protein [Rickenella mellea]|uniref:Glycoside hydrolase family 5 protein n=1 Tax=Rickenella mellea TaxID=50990 RepID=A0A4Y7QCV1_9AGAM|nr:glycoside hydrolase family 5 protein [Rickenella mellea]